MHEEDKKTLKQAGYNTTKLKLRGYKHDESLSLKDFIRNFFTEYNNQFETITLNGELQCYKGSYRSLGDIFRITLYYYPKVRLEEVSKTLKSFDDLVGHICCGIKRRIYTIRQAKGRWKLFDAEDKDEFGYDIADTNSKYTAR